MSKIKVITCNLNGIRAAEKKNFFLWFGQQKADFLCIQETKAQLHQLDNPVFSPSGYYRYFCDAEKKGYSGVAIYSKIKPKKIIIGLGWQTADSEGRYIQLDFENLSVISIYIPSGTSSEERQNIKYEFLDKYLKILKKQMNSKKEFIICGDWNIAHTNIDLKNWKTNQKNSGFLPKEREWLDLVLNKIGFIDSFRYKNPEKIEYTWWSNQSNAWDNNVGWRIDYQIITPGLKDKIIATNIYREEKFSDHAPFIVEYAIKDL